MQYRNLFYIIGLEIVMGCNNTVINNPTNPTTNTIEESSPLPSPTAAASASPMPIVTPAPTAKPNVTPVPSPTAKPTAVPVPTATPVPSSNWKPVIGIPIGGDIAKILTAAKPDTIYQLVKNGSYVVTSTITITAAGVGFDLNGSSVNMTPSKAPLAAVYDVKKKYALNNTASVNGQNYISLQNNNLGKAITDTAFWKVYTGGGSSSNFVVRAPDFDIGNGHITKANTFVHSFAMNLHMHDLVFDNITFGADGKQDQGVNQAYTSDNNLATHNTLEKLTVGKTGTVSVYFCGDYMTIKNSTFAGSYGEYCIRSETTSDASMHRPINTMIDHVTAINDINLYGKTAIGFRMNGGGSVVQNSTISPSLYIGQGTVTPTTAPGTNVDSIVIKNNKFITVHGPQIGVQDGVIATIDSNEFLTGSTVGSIAVATKSRVTITNNIRKLTAPGIPLKKFWATIFTGTAAPEVTETGTKIQ